MALGWPLPNTAYRFRALRRTTPMQQGWDVFALQTAIFTAAHERDGWFGNRTRDAVIEFQEYRNLLPDGVAGPITQRAIARSYITPIERDNKLPSLLLYGAVEHESSFWLGNHSAAREDGARDNGIVQRNSRFTAEAAAFNVPESLVAWSSNAKSHFAAYREGNSEQRAWELAAGSWNAPAWTDRLARGETLPTQYLDQINAYIEAVTHYAFPE